MTRLLNQAQSPPPPGGYVFADRPNLYTIWHESGGLPADTVLIGQDLGPREGSPDIYVCRTHVDGVGWLPGKLVAWKCNVAWGRNEIVSRNYDLAVSTSGCWGEPHVSWGKWLVADEFASSPQAVCRTHYKADRGFPLGGQTDYGMQGGRLVGTSCEFGWDNGVKQVVLPEVFYVTCPANLQHPPKPSPGPPNQSDPKIASITINPNTVTAGQQTTLTITLDRPAPPSGFTVGISHYTELGLDAAIVDGDMPYSLTFFQGATVSPRVIHTQLIASDTVTETHILFTAFHDSEQKQADLSIMNHGQHHGRE